MVTRSQKIRLGVFVSVAVAALVITLVIIVAPKMFEDREIYNIGFRNVSVTGLQEGSAVKYQGLAVGFVSKISIDQHDINQVIVEISLEKDVPIRTDTEAEMAFLGITGLKLIELKSGTTTAGDLPPGSFIQSSPSMTEEITGRAEVIAEKAETILNNLITFTSGENLDNYKKFAQNTSATLEQVNSMLKKNDKPFANTMANVEAFSYQLNDLSQSTQEIVSHVNTLAHSDSLKQFMANMLELSDNLKQAEIVELFGEINRTLDKTNNMLIDMEQAFSKSRTDLVFSIETLKESVEYLNQFSRLISEDPSILIRGAEPKDAPDFKLEK